MDSKQYGNFSLIAGGLLVLLGLIFLAITQGAFNLTWGNFWPLAPIAVGLFVLAMAVTSTDTSNRAGLVLGGTIPLLVGLFFFATTLGIIGWDMQGQLWPVYPLIVGIAFLAAYFTSGLHRVYLLPGAILSIVGLGFLFFTTIGIGYEYIGRFWPVILIMVGVLLLVPGLFRLNSHDTRHS